MSHSHVKVVFTTSLFLSCSLPFRSPFMQKLSIFLDPQYKETDLRKSERPISINVTAIAKGSYLCNMSTLGRHVLKG
jgi:hypothetical protein